jgi:hypothetical protein
MTSQAARSSKARRKKPSKHWNKWVTTAAISPLEAAAVNQKECGVGSGLIRDFSVTLSGWHRGVKAETLVQGQRLEDPRRKTKMRCGVAGLVMPAAKRGLMSDDC